MLSFSQKKTFAHFFIFQLAYVILRETCNCRKVKEQQGIILYCCTSPRVIQSLHITIYVYASYCSVPNTFRHFFCSLLAPLCSNLRHHIYYFNIYLFFISSPPPPSFVTIHSSLLCTCLLIGFFTS